MSKDSIDQHAPFPLTDTQYAYWLGRQSIYTGGGVSCHFYFETDFQNLDVQRLERAINLMVQRHGMLRVCFSEDAQQRIPKQVPYYRVEYLDVHQTAAEKIETLLAQERERLSHEILDVSKGEVFQFKVLRLPDRYRLYANLEVLAMDGTSIGIFLEELGHFYCHPEIRLPDIPNTFRDCVLAMDFRRESSQYQEDKAYWLKRLPDLPSAPEVPILQLQHTSTSSPHFRRVSGKIDAEIWSALKEKAKALGVHESTVLLLLFGMVLKRWSRSSDFLINTTLFNRPPLHEQIDKVIGDFTSLELFAFSGSTLQDKSFRQQLLTAHQLLHKDLSHNLFSGIEISRELAKRKGTSEASSPFVFTSLLHTKAGFGDTLLAKASGYLATPFRLFLTPQVWLDNIVLEEEGALLVEWSYDGNRFPDNMPEAMHAAFCAFAGSAAQADWNNSPADFLYLPPDPVVIAANATQGEISAEYLHTLFLKQAQKTPEAVAVISQTASLSYQELYRIAARIGNGLQRIGAKPNQLVAVLMDKGWEQIAAVLGILNAGAAYLPVSARHPQERINTLLELGEVDIVLTQPDLLTDLALPEHIRIYEITQDCFSEEEPVPPAPVQSLDDIAYVIFTSGSTGIPKGVMISHRAAVNTILDINQRFQVRQEDRVLSLSALNFDLSGYDIFGLLAVGGAVVLPREEDRRAPSRWLELMRKYNVTIWDTVPALLQLLVTYQEKTPLDAPLRLALLSGDWIPPDLPKKIQSLCPGISVNSLGGATEASIWSICYPITTIDPTWLSIPYGKPLRNQTFSVLDAELNPCPIRVPGQLYIGGIGLALGYWGDEEKTKAAFFTHPRTNERLYRTGDLGRWLPDGNIEFLGREDFQVKIQGNRIELGEIESLLLQHPAVQEAVVAALGEDRHNRQLIAYIVAKESDQDSFSDWEQTMLGTITDPAERLQFKLRQPGIRRFAEERATVTLPSSEADDAAYLARQSYRDFIPRALSLQQVARLLACLQARFFEDGILPKYRYGSAGSLYPVQSYLYVKPGQIKGLAEGAYYYHPEKHELIFLSSCSVLEQKGRQLYSSTNRSFFDKAGFALFLVAEYRAIEPMYGAAARDFCLLEAGYMSQLLMSEAPNVDLGLCPVGNMDFEPLREAFAVHDSQELLHSFLGGGIAPEQKTQLQQTVSEQEGEQNASLAEELRPWLLKKLPDYIVPHRYVQMTELPLTANGKVDRKALPLPSYEKTAPASIQPTNDLERCLLNLVREHFALPSLGMTENFFATGANSLDMVQLFNAIRRKFPYKIKLADIFTHADTRQLANLLQQLPEKNTAPSDEKISSSPTDLDPAELDRLAANLDHLSEEETDRLLAELGSSEKCCSMSSISQEEEKRQRKIQLIQLARGFSVSKALQAAAELGIADLIKDTPKPPKELAQLTATHAPSLQRLLRALAALDIFHENEQGNFLNTPLSELLRCDLDDALRDHIRYIPHKGNVQAWMQIMEVLKTGQPSFESANGLPLWPWLEKHPDLEQLFDRSMSKISISQAQSIIQHSDFSHFQTILDIGGGQGLLLAEILQAFPQLHGTLLERPAVAGRATSYLEKRGLAGQAEVMTGDFFQHIPGGYDAYLLKQILHNWSDQEACLILNRCREAIPPHGRLFIFDSLIEHKNGQAQNQYAERWVDLHMMVTLGGKERTEEEFTDLLSNAGFILEKTIQAGNIGIIEAAPATKERE